jgi:hypothetical protein
MKIKIIYFFSLLTIISSGYSQNMEWRNFNNRKHSLAVNLGLIQPLLLKGANVEVDYRYGHFIASYSHGWSLDLSGNTILGEMKRQNISIHLPFSTGFGIGGSYNITKANLIFDLRFEPKFHNFEVVYGSDIENNETNKIANYNTLTLGGGLYITYLPFAKSERIIKGLNISMSFRYWNNIYSSLNDNQIEYYNKYTSQNEIHNTANIGIANTPFIFNISVGYVFKTSK